MLESIILENFKGIERLEIKKLGRLSLIGGKNNCGKTSLLEAFFMLFDKSNPHIVMRHSSWRGVNIIPAEPEYMWAPIFHDFDTSKKIKISSVFNRKTKSLNISVVDNFMKNISTRVVGGGSHFSINPTQQRVNTNALHFEFIDDKKSTEKSYLFFEQGGINLHIESSSGTRAKICFFAARQASNANEDAERLGRLYIENKVNDVIDVLKAIVTDIKDISAVRIADSSLIYVDTGASKKVPISYMGDGVARLLSIVLGIASSKDGIVFIDEVENGLHYSVLKDVWEGIAKASVKFNCQVICTTHSHEFLKAANEALKGKEEYDFAYVRLAKQQNVINGKFFDKDLLDYALQSDVEVR